MHEMALCEDILALLKEQAQVQQYSAVKTVCLEIGRLSCVEPDALRFSFAVVMQDSLAADATLEIIDVPGQAWCFNCAQQVMIEQRYEPCPVCGSVELQINGGEQMRIKELEVI